MVLAAQSKASQPQTPQATLAAAPQATTEALLSRLYADLRRLAHRRFAGEAPGRTLQATALVHEAYLRLMNEPDKQWSHPGLFYSAAATAMRRILVDQARSRQSIKRVEEKKRLPLEDVEHTPAAEDLSAVSRVDLALEKLEQIDARMSKIVELRYFVGLGLEETAAIMGISARTVRREWGTARVWLAREMGAVRNG